MHSYYCRKHVLHIFLLLCAVFSLIFFLTNADKQKDEIAIGKNEEEAEKPWEKVVKIDMPCEVCQATVDILVNEIEKKKSFWENKKGMLDIILQTEILDPMNLCSYGLWTGYADKTPNVNLADMTKTCNFLITEYEDDFEKISGLVRSNKSLREMLEHICKKRTRLCSEIWSENDMPKVRREVKFINLENSLKFLAYNKKQEGVFETESGLQYKILKKSEKADSIQKDDIEGKNKEAGEKDKELPKRSNKILSSKDTVKVRYKGMLLDGYVFDQSDSTTFSPSNLIKGWREGLMLMNVGDIYMLYVPPHLAYGSSPAGKIGSNSLLVFEVELLEVLLSTEAPEDENEKNEKETNPEILHEEL